MTTLEEEIAAKKAKLAQLQGQASAALEHCAADIKFTDEATKRKKE